jgi:hypothetical protein
VTISPFMLHEHRIITETFSQFEFTDNEEKAAWAAIIDKWHNTSGRFYAYNSACVIGARISTYYRNQFVTATLMEDEDGLQRWEFATETSVFGFRSVFLAGTDRVDAPVGQTRVLQLTGEA